MLSEGWRSHVEQYPYFENIEKQIRELIERLENKPKKKEREAKHE
jgi:hypothetical protein